MSVKQFINTKQYLQGLAGMVLEALNSQIVSAVLDQLEGKYKGKACWNSIM